ncbi:hypothetical protein [Paraglaciecola chathamensis]|uniref:Uncharacterized protein n=1 Tax=Paraglaciecola chathamensis TaxID=368405 RepID=A0A8H9LYN7_9ALTE|nr:hypothetical protein [Paraglaciecola oceanifecundans]GGZ83204.1 hypothetical protein GCM10011274_46040 [Paraglaciecola oceanifecundans]|tara:strand:- start:1894 stop:2625 length:732 start_codon:yes stop_codon:yes gene_type:complete
MGILSDAEELAKAFPKASWPTKIIMLSGFFGSITSLASISESVYKWKGFVANYLNLYVEYVKNPFISIVSHLPLYIPPYTLDYFILSVCTVLAMYRAIDVQNLRTPKLTIRFLMIIYLEVLFFTFLVCEDVFGETQPTEFLLTMIPFGLLVMPIIYWLLVKHLQKIVVTHGTAMDRKYSTQDKINGGRKIEDSSLMGQLILMGQSDIPKLKCSWSKYYLQIGLYVLTLLILAGITEGLAKPLP